MYLFLNLDDELFDGIVWVIFCMFIFLCVVFGKGFNYVFKLVGMELDCILRLFLVELNNVDESYGWV